MRTPGATFLITILIALQLPGQLAAQQSSAVSPGDRVRIAATSSEGPVEIDGTIATVAALGDPSAS